MQYRRMSYATAIRPRAGFSGDELQWVRPRTFAPEHHLRSGDETLAVLRLAGWLRREAIAEVGPWRWRIVRGHFLGREISILDAADDRPVARYQGGWLGGGTLEMAGGATYAWRPIGFSRRTWAFARPESEEPLVTFRPQLFSHARGRVHIDAGARRLAELPLLAVFGWYLMLKRRRAHAA